MCCLRITIGVSVWEKKGHTTIRRMTRQQKFSLVLSQHRLLLLGYTTQMNDSHLLRKLFVCAPFDCWNDGVLKKIEKLQSLGYWHECAWQRFIHEHVESLNVLAEKEEKDGRWKNEMKKVRER